jgi:phosphoribosylformylglycinamidine (FGAM) synthase PurS component
MQSTLRREIASFQMFGRCVSREDAQAEIERIAREVLTNPVIEEYSYKLEG